VTSLNDELNCTSIEALVPRGLIGKTSDIVSAPVSEEGLCPIKVACKNGLISSIEIIKDKSKYPSQLLLPRFLETHAHLDKAFTWASAKNLNGTYQNALSVNLKLNQKRTFNSVKFNAERAIELALKNGYRAIRSHVDSFGIGSEETWEALLDLQHKWEDFIELQLVALVPIEYWTTGEGKLFAARIAQKNGLMGGVLVPPLNKPLTRKYLLNMFILANDFGCPIDIHIDESQIDPGAGLTQLIKVLKNITMNVPITCSHSSSMGLLSERKLLHLANELAKYNINVIALPLTNAWLLGRKYATTPISRPIAPIHQLQKSGVTVAIGGDNVRDAWLPIGNFDPISLMSFSMPLAQLAPWNRLGLAPFTTAAAKLMQIKWNGTIEKGAPANLLLLEGTSWSEVLSRNASRKILIDGQWLKSNKFYENNPKGNL
tara:strand:+ start:915 stop:2207 length:1293 start_codon:yes stop_codon:yes gene_type:complete